MKKIIDETALFLRKKASVGETRSAELITQILPGDAPIETRLRYQYKLVGKLQKEAGIKAEQALGLVQRLEAIHQSRMPVPSVRYGIEISTTKNNGSILAPFVESNHTSLEIKADIKSWSQTIIPRKKI